MKVVIRLVAGSRCVGCGACEDVEEKTLQCLYCYAVWLKVRRRAEKLESTLRSRSAVLALGARIREQMKELQR